MLMAFFAFTSSAQTPGFKVMPVNTVIAGRNFTVTFRLTNAEANPPQAPRLNGCDLLYGPSVSTMESSYYSNGQHVSSTQVDFSFTYRANTPGNVTIPSVTVNSGNTQLKSQSITFKILPPDSNQSGGASNQNGQRRGQAYDDEPTPSSAPVSAKDLFVRVSFSKTKAFEQEPIIATIKVYTRYDISNFMPKTQPTFNGFLSEELPVGNNVERENVDGINYYTAVLKKCLLYPQKSGKLTVNAGQYDVTIRQYERVSMGFFVTNRPVERNVTTSSNAATIIVEPLPEPKPAGFTNAVGKFNLETSLDSDLLKTNEAALFTYKISGTGNIKFLTEPVMDFPAGFDVYTPKSDIDAHVTGSNMTGTFKVDYTIVPQEVGNYTIKPAPFHYFDPESRTYKVIEPADIKVSVAKGSSTSAVVEQKDIAGGMKDILHIKPTSAQNPSKTIDFTLGSLWYWLLYILAAATLIIVSVSYRNNLRLKADVAGRKLAKANKVANRRLNQAKSYMSGSQKDSEKFYASLSSAIWGYISDKLGIPASKLTRDNISEKLASIGVDSEGISGIIRVLDSCEMARFTPMGSDEEMDNIYRQASDVIKSIENSGSKGLKKIKK